MNYLKTIADFALGALIWVLLQIFRLIPLRRASSIGGAIARAVGTQLKISGKAAKNLKYIWPDLPEVKVSEIIRQVWDNLGRNFAEYRHLQNLRFDGKDVEIIGADPVSKLMSERKVIFAACHTGNWEVIPFYWAKHGWKVAIMYRRANNLFVDKIIQRCRDRTGLKFMPKGKHGSKQMIETLSRDGHVALLMDQRMSDGEDIPLLGKPALTGTGWLRLVEKYGCAIVPVRCVRLPDARFKIMFEPPVLPETLSLSDVHGVDVTNLSRLINDVYGRWITEYPGQWLWLHQRWGRLAD